jgi:hypothetical protein
MGTVHTSSFRCVESNAPDYNSLNDVIQGMPGIGKTTSIHCLAHQLLGDAYKEGVLELNASDERSLFLGPCGPLSSLTCFIEESTSFGTKSKRLLRRRSPFHLAGIKSSSLTKRIGRYHPKPLELVPCIDLLKQHDGWRPTGPSTNDGDIL